MSKWLVPLIVVGAVGALLFGAWIGQSGPQETHSAPQAQSDQELKSVASEPATALPATWDRLPVGAFLEQASGALVIRDPQVVTGLGLGEILGIGNGELTPLTASYEQETHDLRAAVLQRLHTYDLTSVSALDRLSARVYGWFLENLVAGHRFADHAYTVHPSITSYPQSLERFLTAIHPIRTDQDAADYVRRLSQIGARYDELIDGMIRSEAIGAIPPRFILEATLDEIRRTATAPTKESPLYVEFERKLSAVDGLSPERRDALLSEAETEIERSALPAFGRLASHLEDLIGRTSDEAGVWRHVDGDAYYSHLLRGYTTTDLTADEIHDVGLAEVDRIRAEINEVSSSIGYDPGLPLPELFEQLTERASTSSGDETRDLCEGLLEGIAERVRPAFLRMPRQDLVIVSGSTSAFYSPGSLDGSRPGLFYAPTAVVNPNYELPTLTYHEAIPGHHFQISLTHEVDIPIYRSGLSFTAYSEGWALYAERLAWELGAYDDDPFGDLGRLQGELFRAVRLVVDTGIHALRWTYEQAVDYMIENTGFGEEFARREVVRYIVLPGQATAYKIGMLKLLELRERAQAELGPAFDLAEFHDRVLREGSVPLGILEELIDAYIAERQPSV